MRSNLPSNIMVQLESLETISSAIKGITGALMDDRIRQDNDEEGTFSSCTYGGLMYALETIGDRAVALANELNQSIAHEIEAPRIQAA